MSNLANILTMTRLALLPFIILLFFIPTGWAAWACLWLYIIGAVTDYLDGWVARKFDQMSEFGKLMDPIADKVFVVTILLMLIATDRLTGFWILPVIVILIREFLISGLREYLGPKNIKLPVTRLAKWKTASQMAATGFLIIGSYIIMGNVIGKIGILVAAILTIITGWEYLKTALKHL